MKKYIIKRLLMLIPVLIGVSIIVFLILRVFAPDAAPIVLGQHATTAAMAKWRKANGLTGPIYLQYWDYIKGVLHGNFGTSYYTKTPVINEIAARFPNTIELAIVSIILSSIFGVLIGAVAGVKKDTAFDNVSRVLALVGVSVPIFWLGIMMIILFSGILHWLPSNGQIYPLLAPPTITGFKLLDCILSGDMPGFVDELRHIIMPALALSLYSLAIITRMTRSNMIEALGQDYIRTARAKGISEYKVIKHHALRNALNPVVTIIGLQFGGLLGGAVLTETVFSWPGIGYYTVQCVMNSDFPVVQAVVLLIATIYVLVNLAVDLLYAFLDPRIKYAG